MCGSLVKGAFRRPTFASSAWLQITALRQASICCLHPELPYCPRLQQDQASLFAEEGNSLCWPSGGLGLAALQLRSAIGADCVGTAGSSAKRRYMRSLGVLAAASTRATEFVDELAIADVQPQALLNSLTSPGDTDIQRGVLFLLMSNQHGQEVHVPTRPMLFHKHEQIRNNDIMRRR